MLEHYAVAVAAHVSVEAVKAALKYVAAKRPDLELRAKAAQQTGDKFAAEKVFEEAIGVILADAGTGALKIDGATMTALRGIKFDHQHGTVTINESRVSADVLVTGGGQGATGQTTISGHGTSLKSKGTEVKLTGDAKIVITGNASMKQT